MQNGKTAIYIGRFQPFHNGHMKVIQQIMNQYEHVIVVIGSAEKSHTRHNPFTAGERYKMVYESMERNMMDMKCVHIIPVRDINRSSLYVKHIEQMCPKFDAIFTRNRLLVQLFKDAGYSVEFPTQHFEGKNTEGRLNSTKLRNLMKSTHLDDIDGLPKGTKEVIKEIDGATRIVNVESEDI